MNKRTILSKAILAVVGIFCFHPSYSQDTTFIKEKPVYKFKLAVEIPIVIGCAAWCAYSATYSYAKGSSSQEQILALNKNNINPLDRWAIRPYNLAEDKVAYYPFYAAIPLPLVFFLLGKDTRSDFGKLTFLYMEALAVTGFMGYSATYFVDQYRPYTYSSGTSMSQKLDQNAKNSFYAGHVQIISVSTFFISEVYANYHPESKVKWVFFTLAGVTTAGMGFLRIDAGMHFPSDVLLGAATGALSGILIPYFHNHKIIKNSSRRINFN
jgi:membrane-associated phospholipid phosphatase